VLCHLRHSTSPFICVCVEYFWDRVSLTISLGWPWTVILLSSVFWVARVTGMGRQHQPIFYLNVF
jgi:hypothetical protein